MIVCVPTTKSDRLNDPPVPICPCKLEVHTSDAVRLPSCVSLADPVNDTAVPLV